MQRTLNTVILAFLMLVSLGASAGAVQETKIQGQPSMVAKDGRVVNCGVNFVSVHTFQDGRTVRGQTIEGSLIVESSGFGAVKLGFKETSIDTSRVISNPAFKPLTSFWLKVEGASPTKPSKKVGFRKSDDGNYLLTTFGLEEALKIYGSMITGDELMISVQLKSEKIDRIHKGVVKMSSSESEQALKCLDDLIRDLK
jgi:hypothetical protein